MKRYGDIKFNDKSAPAYQVTSGLTILLSGSVIFDLARPGDTPGWMLSIAIVAALLAAWDMVVGYSRMADRHRDLRARWCSLEIDMLKPGEPAGWFRLSAWQRATSQLFRWHNIAA